jgi:hypothetical protein
MQRRDPHVLAVRILAAVDIAAAVGVFALFASEIAEDGADWAGFSTGGTGVLALVGLVLVPMLLVGWLGVRLWRFDRAGWALQIALGLPIAALIALDMFPPWMLIAIVVPPLLLLQRPVRWLFGIGPDVVLADIDAREATTVAELAARARVGVPVIEGLLARTIARGGFLGAWDRSSGAVYSVDTVVAREHLRRCPHCGGAIEAVGNLARCPFCATEFAKLTGLDFPMPAPIGLAVLAALDHVLCYILSYLALLWCTHLATRDIAFSDGGRPALAWFICGVVTPTLAVGFRWTALRLAAGRRAALVLQGLLLPPAAPYLLRRRVRVLFAVGLGPLRAALRARGQLDMSELGALLGVDRRHADELAVHVTATGMVDSLIDWQRRRLVRRELLAVDGAHGCRHCGAPLRLGGFCAFCGAAAGRSDAPPVPHAARPAWRVVSDARVVPPVLKLVLAVVGVLALAPECYIPGPPERLAFEPVGDYDPAVKETFNGTGILRLAYADDDRLLLSGEQNGLFVWDAPNMRRTLRTAPDWYYSGAHWFDLDLATGTFRFAPYHHALITGTARGGWRVTKKTGLDSLHERNDSPYLGAIAVDPEGQVLVVLRPRLDAPEQGRLIVHAVDAASPRFTITLPEAPSSLAFDPTGARLAATLAEHQPRLRVWDTATGAERMTWSPPARPEDGLQRWVDAVALSPGGARIVLRDLGAIDVLDGDTAAQLARLTDIGSEGPAVFSRDGRMFAVPIRAGDDHGVHLYDADGRSYLTRALGHAAPVTAIAIGEHDVLATGDGTGTVRFYDLPPDLLTAPAE